VKQEPTEVEIKKVESAFRPPPLPEPEVLPELLQRWSLSKGEELFFVQLPDSLPGQPPSMETRPIKTEVQSADGQVMVQKTDPQVDTQPPENGSRCLYYIFFHQVRWFIFFILHNRKTKRRRTAAR
jgi:DNA-directed RNA polymerase III subunit RPC4